MHSNPAPGAPSFNIPCQTWSILRSVDPQTLISVLRTNAQPKASVRCLAKELAETAPELRVILFQPGFFRTSIFSKLKAAEEKEANGTGLSADRLAFHERFVAAITGDPEKGVARMIEAAKGTGAFAGVKLPLRVPIGSDAFALIRPDYKQVLGDLDALEPLANDTDTTVVAAAEAY